MVGPSLGVTDATAKTASEYVRALESVAETPFGFVTVTGTVPSPGGAIAKSRFGFVKRTLEAATLPNLTVAPLMKPVPVITTPVPPTMLAVFGVICETASVGVEMSSTSNGEVWRSAAIAHEGAANRTGLGVRRKGGAAPASRGDGLPGCRRTAAA